MDAQWGFSTQIGPDGKTWCSIVINTPFAMYATMFTPDAAEQIATSFAPAMNDIIRKAREENNKPRLDIVAADALNNIKRMEK